MNFSEALNAIKQGKRVARVGWNGRGMWIALVNQSDYCITPADVQNLVLAPFIAMKTADNTLVPWLASQTDLLAADWVREKESTNGT